MAANETRTRSTGGEVAPEKGRSPWHFLGPLTENPEDRKLIELTREDELSTIESMVLASRSSILYAASGNGKTSLLDAGVIPRFRQRGFAVFRTRPRPPSGLESPSLAFKLGVLEGARRITSSTPSDLHELRQAAEILSRPSVRGAPELVPKLREVLTKIEFLSAEHPGLPSETLDKPIVEFFADVLGVLGHHDRSLIICDQFEELFVHWANTRKMSTFITELGELWAGTELKSHLMFSMREDWVGSMIEFRTAIPDVFSHYFKLNPLTESRARLALRAPLEARSIQFDSDLIDCIVSDLSRRYREVQDSQFGGMNLPRSPDDDPYVEAPALQVVADALWETRDQHDKPFHQKHYEDLAAQSDKDRASPAEAVLESYVKMHLLRTDDAPELEAEEWRDLRIDCLWAMTDGTRHRRAVRASQLLEEVARIRRGVAGLPQVEDRLIEVAIKPLRDSRLVRKPLSPEGEGQYELSHDFAVRSVVHAWRELDRSRAAKAAIQRHRVGELEQNERRSLRLLRAGPQLCYVLFIAAGLIGLLSVDPVVISGTAYGQLGLGMFALAGVVLAVLGSVGYAAGARFAGRLGTLGAALVAATVASLLMETPTYPYPGKPVVGPPNVVSLGDVVMGRRSHYNDIDLFLLRTLEGEDVDLHIVGTKDYSYGNIKVFERLFGSDDYRLAFDESYKFRSDNNDGTHLTREAKDAEYAVAVQPRSYSGSYSYVLRFNRLYHEQWEPTAAEPAAETPKAAQDGSPEGRWEVEPNDPDPETDRFDGHLNRPVPAPRFELRGPALLLGWLCGVMLVVLFGARSNVLLITKLTDQPGRRRLARLLSADVTDVVFASVLGFAGTAATVASGFYVPVWPIQELLGSEAIATFPIAMFQGIGIAYLVTVLIGTRWKTTPGARWNNLALWASGRSRLQLPGILVFGLLKRQLIQFSWAALNLALLFLPWMLAGVLLVRSQKGDDYEMFYDRWAGTRLVDREEASNKEGTAIDIAV